MEQSAGPSLLGRGEAVMRPRNAGELRMRRLQSKGSGKAEQKGGNKDGGRTEQKTAPPQSRGGAGHGPGVQEEEPQGGAPSQPASFEDMLCGGILDFDLGDLGHSHDVVAFGQALQMACQWSSGEQSLKS